MYHKHKILNIYIPKLNITSLFRLQTGTNNMEDAATVIPKEHKTLSSGIPLLEATMNLSEDLAEGTNAPIPSKISEKLEDLKATTGKSLFTFSLF